MARTRLLHPGFFSNELLTELPFAGRLLFAGLWTIADREGRLEDRPRRIRAELFPYDPVSAEEVDEMLTALQARGFVQRYEVNGERFIHITGFEKNQNPHSREQASRIPAPEGSESRPLPAPQSHSDLEIEAEEPEIDANDEKPGALEPYFADPSDESRAVTGSGNRFTDPVSDPGTEAEAVTPGPSPGSPPRLRREGMVREILLALPKAHRDDPAVIRDAEQFADDFPGQCAELAAAQREVRAAGALPWPRLLRPHMPARASPDAALAERKRRFLAGTHAARRAATTTEGDDDDGI